MRSSRDFQNDQTIQELLDAEMQAEAQLIQMNKNIQALQNKVLAKDWWDGNFVIKWSYYLNQQKDHELNLHPKDRVFSLSNVTSYTSGQLIQFENSLLDNNPTHSKSQARKKFHFKLKKDKKDEKNQMKREKKLKGPQKRRRIKRRNKDKIKQKQVKIQIKQPNNTV